MVSEVGLILNLNPCKRWPLGRMLNIDSYAHFEWAVDSRINSCMNDERSTGLISDGFSPVLPM